MIFRWLSFALRVIASFFFVFLLQIQFDGKTLESYLNDFGKKFIVTQSLQKVSQDGVKAIRSFSSSEKNDKSESQRQLASSRMIQQAKRLADRLSLPSSDNEKEEREKNSLK